MTVIRSVSGGAIGRRCSNATSTDNFFNPNVQGNPGGVTADGLEWDGLPTSAAITLPANSIGFARDRGDS
jgi:hypothetical protein